MVLPVGTHQLHTRVPALLEDGENGLPGLLRQMIHRWYDHLKPLTQEIEQCEATPCVRIVVASPSVYTLKRVKVGQAIDAHPGKHKTTSSSEDTGVVSRRLASAFTVTSRMGASSERHGLG